MSLTYVEKKRIVQEERQEKALTIPKEWGMFTPAGNKSISTKAEAFVKELEAIASDQSLNGFDREYKVKKATVKFLKKYHSLRKSKTMSEAGDTAVRESVLYFCDKAWKCFDMDELPYDFYDDAVYGD